MKQAPFTLTLGDGDGSELIEFTYQDFLVRRDEAEARAKQDSLFLIAEKVLEKERERLERILVQYELVGNSAPGPTGTLGAKMRAAGVAPATAASPAPPDEHKAKTGELLRLRVILASIPIDEKGRATELGDDWHEELDDEAAFYLEERELGKFYRFDEHERVLYIRATRPLVLPGRGVLEYKDVGTETALDRQEVALSQLDRDRCANARLRRLLMFPHENRIGEIRPRSLLQPLQPSEEIRDVVERAIAAEDFFLVQGPPGTGKTTFIAEVMAQILRDKPRTRILLSSQANEAVDNAIEELRRLAQTLDPEWRIVRYYGNQKDEEGAGFGVAFREWVAGVRARSSAAMTKLEETGGPVDVEAVRRAVADWQERLTKFDDAREDFAGTVQVFGLTCLKVPALGRRLLRSMEFDQVIVDEAAKATPTEVLVPLTAGRRFILVGDHRQLPPYLDNRTEEELRAEGVDPALVRKSLFEDLFERMPDPNRSTLARQFRTPFAHSGDDSSRTLNPRYSNVFALGLQHPRCVHPPIRGVPPHFGSVRPRGPAIAARIGGSASDGRQGQGSRSDGPWPLGLEAVDRRWL